MTKLLIRLFVKNSDDTADKAVRRKYITLGSFVGIFCNILLFIAKFFVGLISGSVSVMADAFNNLMDIGSSLVTAIGFHLSEKPADKEHPFGHGRIEYMSALTVAVIIILVGVELLKSSFDKAINPSPLSISTVSVILLILSVLTKLWMFLFNRKVGRRIDSAALVATARDSINDSIATTAVLLSIIIFKLWGINIDPYIGMLVALFILYSGFMTIKETISPLLGTPPEKETVNAITSIVLKRETFIGIHDLIVHNYGPGRSFASLHVEVPEDINIVACHEEIDACEKELLSTLGIEVVLHMDPIAVNDPVTAETKKSLARAVLSIDNNLTIHDFRMVQGEKQINLIFDVVVPSDIKISNSDLKEQISKLCKELDPRYMTVVTIDRDYISY